VCGRLSACLSIFRSLLILLAIVGLNAANKTLAPPSIIRVFPLGGQAGTSVTVEILGRSLANATGVEFDCSDLLWQKTSDASFGKLSGIVFIAPETALGPHMFRVRTQEGYSTSAMFDVGQFPAVIEHEPNDTSQLAQRIENLPVEIQGRLDGAADVDYYTIHARAGERWTFDMKSVEQGSALEARMYLLDADGKRIDFNDDRDEYDENPIIERTFDRDGTYFIKLDQYRGPRGFNFGKNCAYVLRISALPNLRSAAPLGLQRGQTSKVRVRGTGLEFVTKIYLNESRRAEYSRMTFPYTMPIQFRPDPAKSTDVVSVPGRILAYTSDLIEAEFRIPHDVRPGLWRLRVAGQKGVSEPLALEISDFAEYDESAAAQADLNMAAFGINGALEKDGDKGVYRFNAVAGKPLHFWTLAAQLGVPHLDTVLQLRNAAGKKLAEDDDVVAGQGSLIGNPDSSLFYTPKETGPVVLSVFDRLHRGGPDYVYHLKYRSEEPSFQLFTTPENFTVARGGMSEISLHMVREAGFAGEVQVWFEGLPPGVEAPHGKFRADQVFEPNADGADMIIPEITFQLKLPESVPAGTYRFRILGVAASEEKSANIRIIEARTTMMMGPLLDLWNFVRRPLPEIAMTVSEPFDARIDAANTRITLEPGKAGTVELMAEHVPENAPIELKDLPAGVQWRVNGRQGDQLTILLEASQQATPGAYEFSIQAKSGSRWASSETINLSIQRPASTWKTKN
jgi:hypothetical protein